MENCQLDKSENCCSWSWNCILWLFPAKSGTTKEVRLKEMTSQTVGGLFLTIDLVAYVESNKLLMNCCYVDWIYWQIMLLFAFNVLMSFPLCNFLGYNFQSHSFSFREGFKKKSDYYHFWGWGQRGSFITFFGLKMI